MCRFLAPLIALAVSCLAGMGTAWAQANYQPPETQLDPRVIQIDEKNYLGTHMDGSTRFVDAEGKTFTLDSMLDKPLILVLSYYTCDGSCSVINNQLAELMPDVKKVVAGQDFRILTVSFDKHDDLKTTGAFANQVDMAGSLRKEWKFATFADDEDLKTQTAKIGFKFFWSPEDRTFLHPGAFIFLAPKTGRMVRILYPPNVDSGDVELAVLDAQFGTIRPSHVLNLAYSLCYSYNYKEGRYTMNIPLFVGCFALAFGITTLLSAIFYFKKVKRGQPNAQLV